MNSVVQETKVMNLDCQKANWTQPRNRHTFEMSKKLERRATRIKALDECILKPAVHDVVEQN